MDVDHLRGWIGRTHESEDLVTRRLLDQFGATFLPNVAPVGGGEAPAGLHWCLAPPAEPMADLAADGHAAKGGFLPPVPLPRRMWAGGTVETFDALRLGDAVVRRSTVEDVTSKRGRTGPLVFVTVRHAVSTPRGPAISERHDIVYREAATSPPPAAPPAAEPRPADLAWSVEGSPVLLGRVPRRYAFRNVAPLIAGPAFRVAGRRAVDGTVRCWTEGADGAVRMEAEASE